MAYELGEVLGKGGMGLVYLAKEKSSGKEVAYKVLLRKENYTEPALEAARRLRDEARAAKINHENLINLIDAGESTEHGPFIVYEYVKGSTLRQRIAQRGPLPTDEFIDKLALPLLRALETLHKAGVIHRDIKSENVFYREDGKYILGDLGLAYFEGREAKTKTGLIVGTPGYIAPESIIRGGGAPQPTSDVYSIAVLFVEALSGKRPFAAATPQKEVLNQLKGDVKPQELRSLGVPQHFCKPLASALIRAPEDRTQDCLSFAEQLLEVSSATPGKTTLTKAPLPTNEPRTKPFWFLTTLFIAAVIFLVNIYKKSEPIYDHSTISFKASTEGISCTFRSHHKSSIDFKILNANGTIIQRGKSQPSPIDLKHHIFSDQLQPGRSFSLKIAKDEKAIEFQTLPPKLHAPPWLIVHNKTLHFDFKTNLKKTPIAVSITADKERRKKTVTKGPIYFSSLPRGKIYWQMEAAELYLAKGHHIPADAFSPANLPWREHNAALFTWDKEELLMADYNTGFARLAPALAPAAANKNLALKWFYSTGETNHLKVHKIPRTNFFVSQSHEDFLDLWDCDEPQKRFTEKLTDSAFFQDHFLRLSNWLILPSYYHQNPHWIVINIKKLRIQNKYKNKNIVGSLEQIDSRTTDLAIRKLKLRPRQRRAHTGMVYRNGKCYSLFSFIAQEPERLIGVLLCKSLDKTNGAMGQTEIRKVFHLTDSRQHPTFDKDGWLSVTATSCILKVNGEKTIYLQLPAELREKTFLAGKPIFSSKGTHCLAFVKTPSPFSAVTLNAHLVTWNKDNRVKIHYPALFSQPSPENRPTTPLLFELYDDKYIVGVTPNILFAIDMSTGAYGKARFIEVIRRCDISQRGVVAILLGNGNLSFKPIRLLIEDSKSWLKK